ncbi:hypothetical protein [Mesorhizobium sp.]|nr:hypothetical protein [Mesorhizobium sp.]
MTLRDGSVAVVRASLEAPPFSIGDTVDLRCPSSMQNFLPTTTAPT